MSTIDQDRAIVAAFNQMRPDVPYRMTLQHWESYQTAREKAGYGRATEENRQTWTIKRTGDKLVFQENKLIWDFAASPNPDAFSFTLAFSFAFAFAFSLAFAGIAFEAADSPSKPQALPAPIPDDLRWLMDFQGTDQGFWYENAGLRITGSPGSLHLHGLSQDRMAEVLNLVRGFRPVTE